MATSTPAGEFVSGPHIGRIVTLTSQLQTVGSSSSSSSERCARQRYVGKFGFMDQHDVAGIDRDIYFRYDDVTTRYVHELRRGMFFEFSLWRYSDHPKWGLRAHLLHPAKLPKSASRLPSPKSKTKKKRHIPVLVRKARGPSSIDRGFRKQRSIQLSYFECDGKRFMCVIPSRN